MHDGWIFENNALKALNPFKKSSFARKSQMWWYGRGNSGDSWLPEEKKANMWPEGEIVVAHDPARLTVQLRQKLTLQKCGL